MYGTYCAPCQHAVTYSNAVGKTFPSTCHIDNCSAAENMGIHNCYQWLCLVSKTGRQQAGECTGVMSMQASLQVS